jgi:hypothetical protein
VLLRCQCLRASLPAPVAAHRICTLAISRLRHPQPHSHRVKGSSAFYV